MLSLDVISRVGFHDKLVYDRRAKQNFTPPRSLRVHSDEGSTTLRVQSSNTIRTLQEVRQDDPTPLIHLPSHLGTPHFDAPFKPSPKMTEMVGSGLGGMTGALQGTATNVISTGQSYLDRFFPPERRQELYAKISKFATEKPMLAVRSRPEETTSSSCEGVNRN